MTAASRAPPSGAAVADFSPRGARLQALAVLAHHGPAAVAQRRRLQTAFGLSTNAPVQRTIHPANHALTAVAAAYCNSNADLAQAVNHQNIRIFLIPVAHDEDARTQVTWNAPRTQIDIEIPMGQHVTDTVRETLHHELFLHARPAVRKHLAAAQLGVAPQYTDLADEDAIEQEEAAEHTSFDAWVKRVRSAVQLNSDDLLDRILISYSGYNANIDGFLDYLVGQNLITADKADEFRPDDDSASD